MKTEPLRKSQRKPLCYDPKCDIHTTPQTNVALQTMFPRASGDFLAKNPVQVNQERLQPYGETINNGKLPNPKPQPIVRNEPVAASKRETGYANRCIVRVTSFRVRSIDPDNLCPKYFIDSLRYAGAIRNDREEDIELQTRQEKVKTFSEERTLIEITDS